MTLNRAVVTAGRKYQIERWKCFAVWVAGIARYLQQAERHTSRIFTRCARASSVSVMTGFFGTFAGAATAVPAAQRAQKLGTEAVSQRVSQRIAEPSSHRLDN